MWWTPVSLLVFKRLHSFPTGRWGGTCLRGAERDFRLKLFPSNTGGVGGVGVQQPEGTLAGHIASRWVFSMKPWALVFLCYRSYKRRWGQWTGSSKDINKKMVARLLHCEVPVGSGEPISVAFIHAEENEGFCGRHAERVCLMRRRKLKQREQTDRRGSALLENSAWKPQQKVEWISIVSAGQRLNAQIPV